MSKTKVKYSEDSEFKCIRRIATKLGLSMPESDDEVINLTQYRRIERAINKEFELLPKLKTVTSEHATYRDKYYDLLVNIKGDIDLFGRVMGSTKRDIEKVLTEAEKEGIKRMEDML